MQELVSVTPAQHMANLIVASGKGSDESSEPLIRTSVRYPVSLLAYVDAMAAACERSRTFVLNNLVVIGVQATLEALPEAQRDAVTVDALSRQAALTEEAE